MEKVLRLHGVLATFGCIVLAMARWQYYLQRWFCGLDWLERAHGVVRFLEYVLGRGIRCPCNLLNVLEFGEEISGRGVFHMANFSGRINACAVLDQGFQLHPLGMGRFLIVTALL